MNEDVKTLLFAQGYNSSTVHNVHIGSLEQVLSSPETNNGKLILLDGSTPDDISLVLQSPQMTQDLGLTDLVLRLPQIPPVTSIADKDAQQDSSVRIYSPSDILNAFSNRSITIQTPYTVVQGIDGGNIKTEIYFGSKSSIVIITSPQTKARILEQMPDSKEQLDQLYKTIKTMLGLKDKEFDLNRRNGDPILRNHFYYILGNEAEINISIEPHRIGFYANDLGGYRTADVIRGLIAGMPILNDEKLVNGHDGRQIPQSGNAQHNSMMFAINRADAHHMLVYLKRLNELPNQRAEYRRKHHEASSPAA